MKRKSLRGLIVVMVAALVFTMMPLTASAASKNPGKTKITSYKVGKYKASTNSAKVTIKWKKAKKATGYIIYGKHGDGNWEKVKKVGRFKNGLIVKKAPAGYISFRVQPIRKVKGKTYVGKMSGVKTKFIKSKLSLEQYVNKFEPELRNRNVNGAVVTFSGNNAIFTVDLTNDPKFSEVNPYSITQAEKNEVYEALADMQGTATRFRASIEANTGIKGAGMTVVMKFKGVELVRRGF